MDNPPAPPDGAPLPPADEVVLKIISQGGFVPVEQALAQLPSVLVYANGTVVRPGPVQASFPGPALPALQTARLAPLTLEWLLEQAHASRLFADSTDFGVPGVTDLDSTSLTVAIDGELRAVDAYALYEELADDPALTQEQRELRDDLMRLISRVFLTLDALGQWTEPSLERILVWALPYFGRDDLDASTELEWPLGAGLVQLDPNTQRACLELSGARAEKVVEAAASATQLTAWRVGEELYSLVIRPALDQRDVCDPQGG